MSFTATNFIFGGIPSEELGLLITSEDGDTSNSGGNDIELITEYIYRRPVPYFYGATQNKVLSFPVRFSSPDEIDSTRSSRIQNILFGQMDYKQLRIVQGDMYDVYMNCFLLQPTIRKIGGQIVGFGATVQCDSPWAWQYGMSKRYTYPQTTGTRTDYKTFNNISANNAYMYPTIIITMNNTGGFLTFTDVSDASRATKIGTSYSSIKPLLANEVLTINSNLEIITSSTGQLRMDYFNKKWPRFVPGKNSLTWSGQLSSLEIQYTNAVKIGG